jgi:hypothetical protein
MRSLSLFVKLQGKLNCCFGHTLENCWKIHLIKQVNVSGYEFNITRVLNVFNITRFN